ncbi:MAG: NAD(P)/FAD-dependent oxidoreductase [Candidatus Thermoplasmatota archaeon]|nr:NAD(P)/FAD-dependent oxidoreductase [Candidatus Thermoplasmatota archaeon]
MKQYDVVVVGAGPSGSVASDIIARYGYDVLLIEEHITAGNPVQCTGLISPETITESDYRGDIEGKIYGANIYTPSLKRYSFESSDARAVVIDRKKFDSYLATRAVKNGVDLSVDTKLLDFKVKDGLVKVRVSKGKENSEISTRILIGADGFGSTVRKIAGIKPPSELLSAFEMEVVLKNVDPNRVEVFFGNNIAPRFFGWLVPAGDVCRIGVATAGSRYPAIHYYTNLKRVIADMHNIKTEEIAELKMITGGIPIGFMKNVSSDNLLLIGDAAGQIKPVSGGGIYYGILSAKIASTVVKEALENGTVDNHALSTYDKKLYTASGREIRKGVRLRKIFLSLNDRDLERLLALLNNADIIRSILDYGDIDHPSILTKKLLRISPELLSILLPKIRTIVSNRPSAEE